MCICAAGATALTSAGAEIVGASSAGARRAPPVAVAERTATFVYRHRKLRLPNGTMVPRRVVTVIRYPVGSPGPFPLIVFGHGYAVTPAPYAALLRAWAAAGYVVAAPIFPLSNANAPGGPDEADIVNQPGDMSLVITRMLTGPMSAIINRHAIAVAGQSDGGETALATAYAAHLLDARVDAAVILSGAELPGESFHLRRPSPPLLATQGTGDTTNLPQNTYRFYAAAPAPKYLLKLLGAGHLPPYTYEQPQLGIVERVTIGFLDRYLKHDRRAASRMTRSGNRAGIAVLSADP